MIKQFTTTLTCILTLAIGSIAQRAVCPQDTIKYILAKASNFDSLDIDPTFTSAVYQYFESPQDITIEGVRFYGYKTDTTGGNTMYLTVEIRNANIDSVPGNTLIATDSVLISVPDSTTGPFNQYAIEVTWPGETYNGPYTVIVKANENSPNYTLLHTDTAAGDGDMEWLMGVNQSGWIRSYNIPTGAFDGDFFFEPIVRYNLNASFINDPECLFDELGDTVQFFNEGSVIADSRMYNRYAFYNFPTRQRWNYGDGSPTEDAINPAHFYPTNGPFVATFTARMLTWTQQICQSTVTQIIKEKPAQDFEYTTNNLEVTFENKTNGVYTNLGYDFGDGNSSSSENPVHKFAKPGTYWVCQSMMTSCGEVTTCKNVAVATNTALNCGKDSVRFTAARGTTAKTITLKNPPTGPKLIGVGQRFPAPQSMIVHGFSFYANHVGLFRDDYVVTCRIWKRSPTNVPDLDTGALATSTVHINKIEVDTNYADVNRYTAIFDKAVNLKQGEDFILTIEYDSNVHVLVTTTDWLEGDGDQDLLAVGKVADSTWVTAASVGSFNVDGQPFDADIIIEPLIEYNLNANFTYDFECMVFNNGQRLADFQNLSSPIAGSRFYNQRAFYGSTIDAYRWRFIGPDSTDTSFAVNANYLFHAPGPFDVEVSAIVDGWTNSCIEKQQYYIPVTPTAGFNYTQNLSDVFFADSSFNTIEYLWTFSDSTVSTLSDPVHYFTRIGTFEVCQYVSNVCGSDTLCDSITVNVLGLPEEIAKQIRVYPNPANQSIHIEADYSDFGRLKVDLLDLTGRIVKTHTSSSQSLTNSIYVGDLPRGNYLMRLAVGDFIVNRKVSIIH